MSLADTIKQIRAVQANWRARDVAERLRIVGSLPRLIAENAESLASSVVRPAATKGEVLASEVLPLAEACRYVARRGHQVLSNKQLAGRDRAWWMGSVTVREIREPLGIVLIIGPSNYPLLLPGVQLIQALAAGNAVLIKPAPQSEKAIERLAELCARAGMLPGLIVVLPTRPEFAQAAISVGVDKIIFTGSAETGRSVARQAAETLTPATLELSGSDAVFVLDDADLDRVAKSVAYAVDLNAGQSCIAPRRLYATEATLSQLLPRLRAALETLPARHIPNARSAVAMQAIEDALGQGAQMAFGELDSLGSLDMTKPIVLSGVTSRMHVAFDDLFAPVLSLIQVNDLTAAREDSAACPYALGAAVFGRPEAAKRFAARVAIGCITINDVLVPSGDPRVSFGGWKGSGYGVTRGLEGLRELTRLKVICERRGRWLPHLTAKPAKLAELMQAILLLRHGGRLGIRWRGLKHMLRAIRG